MGATIRSAPEAAALGDEGDGPCIGSARGGGGATAVAAMGSRGAQASMGAEDHGLSIRRSWRRRARGALCRGRGVAGARAEAGTRVEAGARMGATEAEVPRAADSLEIGMGASSMGVAPGHMRVRSQGSRWRMRPLLEKGSFGSRTLVLSAT
jgi:hypothetical protein